jgi:hypothetical protein
MEMAYLLRAGKTSVGLTDFQTLEPNAIAIKISVAAHVTAEALVDDEHNIINTAQNAHVVVFSAAVNSVSSTRIKAPVANARPI